MRIAVITPTFPPYAGGIGNVAAFNARQAKSLGHEVEVFTPKYREVTEEITDLKITRVPPLFQYGNAAVVPTLPRMLKGFNIIHIHYPFFGGAEIVWLYRRKLKKSGTKIVLHYHMDVVGEGAFKNFFTWYKKFFLPKILKMSDRVIVTSLDYGNNSNIGKFILKTPKNFFELPNGVDGNKFSPAAKDKDLVNEHGLNLDTQVMLFVGGLDKAHYFKGVEYLIEAVSRLKDQAYGWKLIIAGEGDLKKDYISLAKQLKLDDRVIFVGYLAGAELPKYYNLADVVVLPSVDKSEAFGLALIEGMACGKAVVASNLAGVRNVVDADKNGLLVEPRSVDDLAAKLHHLLSNPELAKKFGQAGRQKVEQKYDWKIVGTELNKLYQSL